MKGIFIDEARDSKTAADYVRQLEIKTPGIDQLVKKVIAAGTPEELKAATHALDRVLLAHDFVVPTYTLRASRIAYWDRLMRPAELPKYSVGFPDVWWSKPAGQ